MLMDAHYQTEECTYNGGYGYYSKPDLCSGCYRNSCRFCLLTTDPNNLNNNKMIWYIMYRYNTLNI